jgi:hypothetical protein
MNRENLTREEVWDCLRTLKALYANVASYEMRHGHIEKAVNTISAAYREDQRLRQAYALPDDPDCFASPDLAAVLDDDGWPLDPQETPEE